MCKQKNMWGNPGNRGNRYRRFCRLGREKITPREGGEFLSG